MTTLNHVYLGHHVQFHHVANGYCTQAATYLVVLLGGAEPKSRYIWPMAARSMKPTALEEVLTILPELRDRGPNQQPEGARLLCSGLQFRKLHQRHADNRKPLVM